MYTILQLNVITDMFTDVTMSVIYKCNVIAPKCKHAFLSIACLHYWILLTIHLVIFHNPHLTSDITIVNTSIKVLPLYISHFSGLCLCPYSDSWSAPISAENFTFIDYKCISGFIFPAENRIKLFSPYLSPVQAWYKELKNEPISRNRPEINNLGDFKGLKTTLN